MARFGLDCLFIPQFVFFNIGSMDLMSRCTGKMNNLNAEERNTWHRCAPGDQSTIPISWYFPTLAPSLSHFSSCPLSLYTVQIKAKISVLAHVSL